MMMNRRLKKSLCHCLMACISVIGLAIATPLAAEAQAGCSTAPAEQPASESVIFSRTLISRAYEGDTWVMHDPAGGSDRETPSSYAAAAAGMNPSYVSGLIYLHYGQSVTQQMANDYATIRNAVLAVNPAAKFDVEISLNPNPPDGDPFPNAAAVTAMMTTLDCQLHPDIWFFDFYSTAYKSQPAWVTAAINYAHSHNQLVGGNVFNNTIPPGSDFAAFVDDASSTSNYGFDYNTAEIAAMKASLPSAYVLGHLQSNAQNGSTTESCQYSQSWSETEQSNYLLHWASKQTTYGFQFMYPLFYPLCPGAVAYDPLDDPSPQGGTLYTHIQNMMGNYNP